MSHEKVNTSRFGKYRQGAFVDIGPTRISITPDNTNRYYFVATLQTVFIEGRERRIVGFSLKSIDPNTQQRNTYFQEHRMTEIARDVIEHWDPDGIRFFWEPGGTNYQQFKKARTAFLKDHPGQEMEAFLDAAKHTWTFRNIAEKNNFKRVYYVNDQSDPEDFGVEGNVEGFFLQEAA